MIRYALTFVSLFALGGALSAAELEAQTCESCVDEDFAHKFDFSLPLYNLHYCGDGPEGECHTSWKSGSCGDMHDFCEWEEEDVDALTIAIGMSDTRAITDILSPLARKGMLTHVPEREFLLVAGCDGHYVAGFPLTSSETVETVVMVLAAQNSADR